MAQRSIAGDEALKACKKFPNTASRTLARMLREQHPKLFTSIEHARALVRMYRGNIGNRQRQATRDHGVRRANGRAGEVLTIPDADEESWIPHEIKGPARVACFSDIHVPYHSKRALEIAIAEAKRRNPTHLLLNGDSIDFYGISRFDKNPENRDAVSEIEVLVKLLRYLDQEFPKAQKIYKIGNHEDRWDKFLWANAPVLYKIEALRLAGVLGLEYGKQTGQKTYDLAEHGWAVIGDKRPVMLGQLPVFHGHEFIAGSPVNPARGAYLRTSHTVLIGHHHSTSQHTQPDLWHSETVTWSTGALCGLHPQFMPVNRWNNGWAWIDVDKSGEFNVDNMRITASGRNRAS